MIKRMRVLAQHIASGYARFFGVYAAAEVVRYQVTSRPLTRMLMALAVPAIVLMKSPGASTCPTNSGKVYTSLACSVLVLVIRF